MKKVDTRKIQVLKYIVETYIKTGDVMGSQSLLDQYQLGVSSATIRNDMAALEKMGLIFQPYNSAGRLPTDRGIRIFVDYLMEELPTALIEAKQEAQMTARTDLVDDILYGLVSRLTNITHEVTFACIPREGALCYLGLTHLFEQALQGKNPDANAIVTFLENKKEFIRLMIHLNISQKVSVYIGDEHIGGNLAHTSIVVKEIHIDEHIGYLGMIGPIQMDYAFNIASLRQIL